MAFGVHKYGQGYWVRVLTATLIGIVAIAVAAWVATESHALIKQLPSNAYRVTPANTKVNLPAGTPVALLAPDATQGAAPGAPRLVIGSAVLRDPLKLDSQLEFVIEQIEMNPDHTFSAVTGLRNKADGADVADLLAQRNAIPPIDPALASTGIAVVCLLIGAIVAFIYCGSRPSSVDFLVATDFEMKRINWSTRKEVVGSTWVVVGACVVISGALFVFDNAILQVLKWINIWEF